MRRREPGAAAEVALERSLLPLPQCTGRRRRQQHHRPPRGLRRRPRGPRARGALARARGEPGSDGQAPAGRPRLRRPAPPRPARRGPPRPALPRSLPAAAWALPSRRGRPPRRGAASAQAGGVGAVGPRHGRVRALHKGKAARGRRSGEGAARPGAAGCRAGAGGGARARAAAPPPSPAFQNPQPGPPAAEAPSSFGRRRRREAGLGGLCGPRHAPRAGCSAAF